MAPSLLKLAPAVRVISDVEVTLRNFCFEWLSDEYQSFSLLLGNQPPTGCPTLPMGGDLSELWQEISNWGVWFISFSACSLTYWKFHVRLIRPIKVTFWHFDYEHLEKVKCVHLRHFPSEQCALRSFCIPELSINQPQQPLTPLQCFLSNWLSGWLVFTLLSSGKQWSRSW